MFASSVTVLFASSFTVLSVSALQGGEGEKTKLSALNGQLHPSLERALAILKGAEDYELSFETLLEEQVALHESRQCGQS